jgi:hypothetical protein
VGFDGGVQVADNLCYMCKHKSGPFKCRQTAQGLSPGWPRNGGWLTSNAPDAGRKPCPRYDNAPPWPYDYAGDLSELGLRVEADLELLRAAHGAS